jgi:hypothetical protein
VLIALVIVGSVWGAVVNYLRYVAAREKAGSDGRWLPEFVGTGWMRASTERGKRYSKAAIVVMFFGPLPVIVIFVVGARSGWWR